MVFSPAAGRERHAVRRNMSASRCSWQPKQGRYRRDTGVIDSFRYVLAVRIFAAR